MIKHIKLIQEDEHYFAKSGRIKYYPLVIDHGYGATLVDIEGKTYIDLLSSASSQNVGHKAQVDKFIHYPEVKRRTKTTCNLVCSRSHGRR